MQLRADPLTAEADGSPAEMHLHPWTGAEDLADVPGADVAHGEVLAVVQDQQGVAITEVLLHRRLGIWVFCVGAKIALRAMARWTRPGSVSGARSTNQMPCSHSVAERSPKLGDQTGLAEATRSDDAHETGRRLLCRPAC